MTTLKMERNFSADPEKVFAFISQTDNLLKWWGPEGVSINDYALDFTKPGAWSSVMVNAEGGRFKVTGEVLSVDAPNSIELTWAWHDENDERGHESRVLFEVASDPSGGTRFVMTHSGLADEESSKNHNMGWTSSFVKLERLAN